MKFGEFLDQLRTD